MSKVTRRRFGATAAGALATVLAGCSSENSQGDNYRASGVETNEVLTGVEALGSDSLFGDSDLLVTLSESAVASEESGAVLIRLFAPSGRLIEAKHVLAGKQTYRFKGWYSDVSQTFPVNGLLLTVVGGDGALLAETSIRVTEAEG